MIGYRKRGPFGAFTAPRGGVFVRARRRRREVAPQRRFDGLGVEVAHRDERHQIGSIPALVECRQLLRRGAFDHLSQAGRLAFRVARVAEQGGELAVVDTRRGIPLIQNQRALLRRGGGRKRDREGPFAQHLDAGLQRFRRAGRYGEMKYRRVEAGLHVLTGDLRDPDRRQVVSDLLLGEPLGAAQRHARHEARQAALVILLEHRTGPHRKPQLGLRRRFGVAPDVVLNAAGQGAVADGGVERQRCARNPRLRKCRNHGHGEQCQHSQQSAPEAGAGQSHRCQ